MGERTMGTGGWLAGANKDSWGSGEGVVMSPLGSTAWQCPGREVGQGMGSRSSQVRQAVAVVARLFLPSDLH